MSVSEEVSRDSVSTPPPTRGLASLFVPILALLGVAALIAVTMWIHGIGAARRAALDAGLPTAGPPALDDEAAFAAALAARRPPVPQLVRGATSAFVHGAPGATSGASFDPLEAP